VFHAAEAYPLLVTRDPNDSGDAFFRQFLAYLESGFPLFVAMDGKRHAIAAIGHAWSNAPASATLASVMHAWERVDSVVVVDDNDLPYKSVPTISTGSAPYTTRDFTAFIVPLPEKIFYPAEAVEPMALTLAKYLSKQMPMPPEGDLVLRYFVTTVSGLRRYMRHRQSEFGDNLVAAVMQLDAAQFVWVVEYASTTQWNSGTIAARAVLDATASPRDVTPAWFAHGQNTAIFFDRTQVASPALVLALKPSPGVSLSRMEQNLPPIRAKP
jgi:hypothetical protein